MGDEGGGVPYIGSRISLTSKSAIRYEGTLYTIDTSEATVALKDVRSFGSENRQRAGGYVAPSADVYDYIIFRGPDIAELNVISTPTALAPTAPNGLGEPTAATIERPTPDQPSRNTPDKSKSTTTTHPQTRSWGPPPSAIPSPGVDRDAPTGPIPEEQTKDATAEGSVSPTHHDPSPSSGEVHHEAPATEPHGDNHRPHRGGRGGNRGGRRRGGRTGRVPLTLPAEDFDFDAMNEKFDKVALASDTDLSQESQNNTAIPEVKVKYDKSTSFFDSLEQAPRDRSTASQRRNADFETFGELNQQRNYGRRRGRGGRSGRGGRGRSAQRGQGDRAKPQSREQGSSQIPQQST